MNLRAVIVSYKLLDQAKNVLEQKWKIFHYPVTMLITIEVINESIRKEIIADQDYNYSYKICYIQFS